MRLHGSHHLTYNFFALLPQLHRHRPQPRVNVQVEATRCEGPRSGFFFQVDWGIQALTAWCWVVVAEA